MFIASTFTKFDIRAMETKSPTKYLTCDVGLVVFLNNEDMTGWFNSSDVNDDRDFTNILITKTNNTQLQVTFKSGMNVY